MPADGGYLFFNHSTGCLARLVVAIHSLRKLEPLAEICVLDTGTPEAAMILAAIDNDPRLILHLKRFEMKQLRRNSAYVAKAGLWRHSPFRNSLLVDADVLFLKSPEPLLEMVCDTSKPGFVLTKFSDWTCSGRTISSRLEKWRNVKCDCVTDIGAIIDKARRLSLPAVNTGLVGMRRDKETSPVLEIWERLTLAGCRNPWTDELAAQIIATNAPVQLADEIYNSSVLYAKDRENAVCLHLHGKKHTRPEAGGRWIAAYRECCEQNMAGIREWGPATDSRLAGLA